MAENNWDGVTERRKETQSPCKGYCIDHTGNQANIDMLISRTKTIEQQVEIIPRLSGRLNALLWFFGMILTTIIGIGAFSLISYNKSRDLTAAARLEDRQFVNDAVGKIQLNNSEAIQKITDVVNDFKDDMNTKVSTLNANVQASVGEIKTQIAVMEAKHQTEKE
jgi:hypothetical protein